MNPRIALIGVGKWGENLARVLSRTGMLAAVCDADAHRVNGIAAHYGVPGVADVQVIMQDATIDAVMIATPAQSHVAIAREALLHGKDVFIEKPMALSVQEGEELVRLARTYKRMLMIGHVVQYHPAVDALRTLLQRNELGDIKYIQCHRLNFGRVRPAESILWSFAPHDVSLLISLLGMPQSMHCTSAAWRPDGTPDMTISHFTYASGAGAHVYVSWLHPYKEQRMTIIGSQGMAVFDGVASSLTVYPHALASAPGHAPGSGRVVPLSTEEPLERECNAFAESIRTRTAPRTDGEEGLCVLRVLDACQRSHISGKPENIESHSVAFAIA